MIMQEDRFVKNVSKLVDLKDNTDDMAAYALAIDMRLKNPEIYTPEQLEILRGMRQEVPETTVSRWEIKKLAYVQGRIDAS